MNVIQEVVAKNWCIGCGMCAAVCPKKRLKIVWNDRGEYNPVEVDGCDDCSENCSLCYQVCPAHGKIKNETDIGHQWYGQVEGIQHTDETGYFLSSYVGYSKDHRANGASGGMATWMLETLLTSGEVDAVAAVGRTTNPDKLFEFRICQTIEEIRGCSRSAYYPVETSQVIQHILNNDGRYAIIGLPCVCKAIRLAQDKMPRLKQRIKVVLGLTCGHQCSRFFAEYICALGGGNPHELKEFIFRTKDLRQPASNHAINFRSGEGSNEVAKQILWKDGVSFAYMNGYFQLPGCFYCDDVFAECADVVFMDAWLPEYSTQPEGHSLVLLRDLGIDRFIRKAVQKDELSLVVLPLGKVIQSEQGVLDRKRKLNLKNAHHPNLRTNLYKRPRALKSKIQQIWMTMAETSPRQWIADNKSFGNFNRGMLPLKRQLMGYYTLQRLLLLPFRIFSRLKKKLYI